MRLLHTLTCSGRAHGSIREGEGGEGEGGGGREGGALGLESSTWDVLDAIVNYYLHNLKNGKASETPLKQTIF